MDFNPLQFRIAGICALATAGCAVAGAVVSVSFGLGGQNLPVASHEQLAQLAENRVPFLIREWCYLLLAVFALGEGMGLYFLLRKSPLAIWALITWIVGLTIGIAEDSSVIAIIHQVSQVYPEASDRLRDSMLITAGVAFESIKVSSSSRFYSAARFPTACLAWSVIALGRCHCGYVLSAFSAVRRREVLHFATSHPRSITFSQCSKMVLR